MGSNFKVDSSKPMTVVTQFLTDNGQDDGKVNEVRRFYVQDGKKIETPTVTLQGNQHDSITEQFCQDWVDTTKDGTNFIQLGGMTDVDSAVSKGLVLVMSLWDDHFANMLWLDSIYPTDSTDPTNYRGSCSTDSGVAADVESKSADSKVVFSNIRYGPMGSTNPNTPSPSPTPTPTPTPSGSSCCSWDGKYCGKTTDYCAANEAQCEDCKGNWCTSNHGCAQRRLPWWKLVRMPGRLPGSHLFSVRPELRCALLFAPGLDGFGLGRFSFCFVCEHHQAGLAARCSHDFFVQHNFG